MVSVQEAMDIMEGFAPKHLAEDWDNPGLLVGSPAQRTERIVCCLDVSDGVVQQAIEADAHLIVAHHPLIFKAMKNVRTDLPLGARIAKLLTCWPKPSASESSQALSSSSRTRTAGLQASAASGRFPRL